MTDLSRAAMLGLLIGDAVGVPYEFKSASDLPSKPLIDLPPPAGFPRTFASIPVGWWSDDGAHALALARVIRVGFTKQRFAEELLAWWQDGRYMPKPGRPFDCGNATAEALQRYRVERQAETCGLTSENSNGNGSLMRCLPVALYGPPDEALLIDLAHQQSSVTHAHARSQVACAYYALWARQLMKGVPRAEHVAFDRLRDHYVRAESAEHLHELLTHVLPLNPLEQVPRGYVVDTLRVAVALNAVSSVAAVSADLVVSPASAVSSGGDRQAAFAAVVRDAIAYGGDTDTNAAVAAGIAVLRLGSECLPRAWLSLVEQHDPARWLD